MYTHPFFSNSELLTHGLNLHAVLAIDSLPEELHAMLNQACENLDRYQRLVLIGHGGRDLWNAVSAQVLEVESDDPIDTFTVETLTAFFTKHAPEMRYIFLYPGASVVPLQQLGELAGWHHPSPFRIGVNSEWGSWFAYRALLLIDAPLDVSQPITQTSPCERCASTPCISACPADALSDSEFSLQRCIDFRLLPDSPCRECCLARLACPVGESHRYPDAQVRYHYSRSLRDLERYVKRN